LLKQLSGHHQATALHSRRVAGLALGLVDVSAGARSELRARVQAAGLLHDVGKLTITAALLHKPSRLTAEELAAIRGHSAAGAQLFAANEQLRPLARIVRAIHERYDGAGYPDGLRGGAIPMEARIIATPTRLTR